jgi:hypothetical protein
MEKKKDGVGGYIWNISGINSVTLVQSWRKLLQDLLSRSYLSKRNFVLHFPFFYDSLFGRNVQMCVWSHTVAQAVSHRILTMDAHVCSQISPYEICAKVHFPLFKPYKVQQNNMKITVVLITEVL